MLDVFVAVLGLGCMAFGLFRLLSWTTVPVVLSIPVSYVTLIGFASVFSMGHGAVARFLAARPSLGSATTMWGQAGKSLEVTSLTSTQILLCAFLVVLASGAAKISQITNHTASYLAQKHQIENEQAIAKAKRK